MTAATTTSVSLGWGSSSDNVGVQGYGVYMDGQRITTTPNLAATVGDLRCNLSGRFEVDAYDAAGNRSAPAAVTASTAPCTDNQAPSPPLGLRATSRTATSIGIAWSPSTDDVGVAGYTVYRNGSVVGTSATTSSILTDLACNTNYTVAIDAYDGAGNQSARTTAMIATTACPDTTPPSTPTGLAASGLTASSANLTWNPSTDNVGVVSYDIYRNGTRFSSETATSSTQTGLSCGTAYAFAVSARDAAGNASARAQVSATTAACPAPSEWTYCAAENARCVFSGTRDVRYGKGTVWTAPRTFVDGVDCSNAVFGDPLHGTVKECWTRPSSGSSTPPPPPPPPPPPGTGTPAIITQGGTYSGTWSSSSSTPAVRIATTAPVTIVNSTITNSSGGELIRADAGANVTVAQSTLNGGNGRAVYAYNVKSLVVRNCSINRTSGIRLDGASSSASVTITRNKVRNIQAASYNTVFAQLANVTTATVDISWNEVINTFGQSGVEDNINMFASAHAKIHDNYIQGAYPASSGASYSGSGIMLDSAAFDNEVWNNQVVATTNAGIGIASGWNNRVHDNRVVSDGRLDNGTPLAAANVGVFVWNYDGNPNWANNSAWNNTSGWLNAAGQRADWWLPNCTGSCSNQAMPGTPSPSAESAEYQSWLAKLAANGVTVGA